MPGRVPPRMQSSDTVRRVPGTGASTANCGLQRGLRVQKTSAPIKRQIQQQQQASSDVLLVGVDLERGGVLVQ